MLRYPLQKKKKKTKQDAIFLALDFKNLPQIPLQYSNSGYCTLLQTGNMADQRGDKSSMRRKTAKKRCGVKSSTQGLYFKNCKTFAADLS